LPNKKPFTERKASETTTTMTSFAYNVKVNAMQSALDSAIKDTISRLSKRYGFDYQEALAFLGVEEKLRVTIGTKIKQPKREQPKFPLPFSGVQIEGCCIAIVYNKGLYSQCLNEPGTDGLCVSCSKKAAKTPFGKPEYGTIEARVQMGDDYTDQKGKKPVHFTLVMKKMQLTEEIVLGEVTKFNLPFDTNHFSEQQTKKGRPKKSQEKATRSKKATNQIEVVNDEDLIEKMIEEGEMGNTPEPILQAPAQPANPQNLSLQLPEPEPEPEPEIQDDISDITDEDIIKPSQANTKIIEKETKAEKATKKAEEKAKKEAEKAAKKEAEKALKEAEKAIKKEAEKAKKAEEKAKKDAEEKAKKDAEEKAKKDAEEKVNQKVSNDELSVEKFDSEEPEAPKPKAKIIMYCGKKYIVKHEDNSVYDAETKIEVGYWNPAEKTIVFEEDEEDEEDEEEEEEEEEELAEDSDEE
jgi:hypothetical protein